MTGSPIGLIVHGTVALALIAAYAAITISGHDGTDLLVALVSYLGGVGTQVTLRTAGAAPPP